MANIGYFICGAIIIAITLALILWTMWAIGDVWYSAMAYILGKGLSWLSLP